MILVKHKYIIIDKSKIQITLYYTQNFREYFQPNNCVALILCKLYLFIYKIAP